ncbi:MAG TPA: CHC2 zinc finger domain-containing protein [Blastocatellia bacterium]|nr:CHC2 zinc finger domain-containing protein [Blastocatellia bacterium]
MLIDKAEIERVKRANDLVAVVRARGVKLTRRGKQLVGLCPFHEDHEPSFIVDPKKQLWNCLGACNEGGDVYRFVMKADGVDFREAHVRLGGREAEAKPVSADDLHWLERAVEHYHKRLLETPAAQQYLRSRGIAAPEIITTFRLGYSDGTLGEKLPAEGKAALRRIGVLTGSGRELMNGCVLFPLVAAASSQVVSIYGRHTERRQHLYLPGERRGVFNPQGARNTDEVIIAESVIDAAALWSAGLRNMIPIYGTTGLTEEITAHLRECRVRRAVLMLDSDEAGRAAADEIAARLRETSIEARSVELPAKDPSEFIARGGSVDDVRALIAGSGPGSAGILPAPALTAPPSSEQPSGTPALPGAAISENKPQGEMTPDGVISFTFNSRQYRIRGLSPSGLDRLKVNVRVTAGQAFHLDTLDLYQARARGLFAQSAAKACGVSEQQVGTDLLGIVERLETERLQMRRAGEAEQDAPMTAEEREAALGYLRSPNLCERIVDDFRKSGLVGERATVLTAYLGSISRKLAEPLGVLIVARTGAGKSSLQDALCGFVPPEDLVRVTRLTGQALFYKDPYSLQRKMLAIAEEEGAAQAVYSLRTLASDQHLSIAATRTDPQTGKLHTEHYDVYGPVVIVITTTSAEAFDEETRSRFVLLTMDESREQTRAILERQRRRYSLEGVMERARSEQVRRLHHNVQRMIKPLEVVNPYAELLTYPDDRLIHRREQKKYLALINAIALLHQHQRETKRTAQDDAEVDYVEVTLEDIELANELAGEVLKRSLDEVSPPVRGMYREFRALCKIRAEESGCRPDQVQLSRREIREATGWSDWQVRTYCQQLADMEYLYAVSGSGGKRFVYELAFYTDDEEEASGLRGLVSIEQLKEQLKENGNGASVPRAVASGSKRAVSSPSVSEGSDLAVERATLR